MPSKAELEQELESLKAKLEQKDQLILEQGEALKLSTQGSGDPQTDNAALLVAQGEAEELRRQLAVQQEKLKRLGVGEEIEKEVRIKMHMGLSREDAIVCARRQQAHNDVMAKKFDNETVKQEALIHAAAIS